MLLYIDPGTGSMLFTILLGVIGAAIYSLRMLMMKLKFVISGGKIEKNANKIPFLIYSDDKRYWNVFEPICREFNKRGVNVMYMTSSKDDPVFDCEYEHINAEYIGKDSKAFAKLNYVNASIVLSTTPGLGVYQWKRSRDVDYYVHILHAPSEVVTYRMFGLDYYDAVLVSGEYQIKDLRALEELRNIPEKEVYTIGIPYMDEMAKRYEIVGPIGDHERTVLLAPSWGPSAIFSVYGGKLIDALLKTGYHVIVRPHPQSFESEAALMDKLMKDYPNSDKLEWNRDRDNFEVLRRSDILITDFSGVIFDFALIYNKPVIYTDPKIDVSPYDAWWLKKPLWTASALPRLGKELTEENADNIKDLIDLCLSDNCYEEGRKEVKGETWEFEGQGTQRTVEFLLNKYNELQEKEMDK